MSALVKNATQSEYISYPLPQILHIVGNIGGYTLSQDIVDRISDLSNKVGAPTYNRTPVFHKHRDETKIKKKSKQKAQEINDADWDTIRNFQVTEREQKDGIDKLIDDIRRELNKLSDKNYDKITDRIKSCLVEMVKCESFDSKHKEAIALLIFDIATTNKFYSALYAKLYKDLVSEYDFIESEFEKKFATFNQLFNHIEYVNPDDDYNMFCKINKENESRRALSMFIVNMVKLDVLSEDYLIDIIKQVIVLIKTKIAVADCKEQVNELSENIYTLVTESYAYIKDSDDFDNIMEHIKFIKGQKSKDHLSLSSKSVFKYMDMFDYISKKK